MFPSKSNCKVHRVEPLKESTKLRMGCAASKANQVPGTNIGTGGNPDMDSSTTITANASLDPIQYPPPEAFVVPFGDEIEPVSNESLIKKHPPKRLQRLTEASVVATTIEDLEEKLAKAEVRRQKYLQERVEKIETNTVGLKGRNDDDNGQEGNGDNQGNDQNENAMNGANPNNNNNIIENSDRIN